MIGGALLDRIAAAGAAASLAPDGRVRIAGASRLSAELVDLLRENRAEVARALAARRSGASAEPGAEAPVGREEDPVDAAERAAMADHYTAPANASPWHPGGPDPLRDGLLAAWRAGQRQRLGALAQRLRDARPKREHGVRQLEWDAWTAAARAAATSSGVDWAAWRETVGTEGAPWPPPPSTSTPAGGAHA